MSYVLHLTTTKNFERGLEMIQVYADHQNGWPGLERIQYLHPECDKAFTVLSADPKTHKVRVRLNRRYDDAQWITNDLTYHPRYVRSSVLEHEDPPKDCMCTPCCEGGLDIMFHYGRK